MSEDREHAEEAGRAEGIQGAAGADGTQGASGAQDAEGDEGAPGSSEYPRRPILAGEGASDYERYLRTDALLSLQKPLEEQAHRDELLFQVVHQTSELWLKLATNEVAEAGRLLHTGALPAANRLLRRATDCLDRITEGIHMLEHLSPWEYTEIRPVLGHGSGFDSPGFNAARTVTAELGEAFRTLLEARGLSIVDIYHRGRELEDLYQLAELMLAWDERLILWRVHHFKIVERVIGLGAVGTQGTPVEVMGRLIHQRHYPKLWEARDELTELAGL